MKIKTIVITGIVVTFLCSSGLFCYLKYINTKIPKQLHTLSFIADESILTQFENNLEQCKKNNGMACRRVAEAFLQYAIYNKDKNFTKEKKYHEQEKYYLKKACSLKEAGSCDYLAQYLKEEKDLSDPQNVKELNNLQVQAFNYASQQCKLITNYTAEYCSKAFSYAYQGFAPKIISNDELQTYEERACFFDDPLSCSLLYYTAVGLNKNTRDNIELRSRASQTLIKTCSSSQGISKGDGCFYAAKVFDYNKNYHSAEDFYKKACDLNHEEACYELGKYYAEGEVVRYKPKDAEKYLSIACDSNISEACQLLKKLNIDQKE